MARIDRLRDAVRRVRARAPFRIDAWVVLPDHMHCLWTLPPGDVEFAGRWRAIKTAFVEGLPEREVWQRRYWPYSSFRRCVEGGLSPAGWRGGGGEPQQTGERL